MPRRRGAIKVRGADALALSLVEHRERAELYRQLATLRLDVPLAEALDDLALSVIDRALLEDVCSELGDESMLARVRW